LAGEYEKAISIEDAIRNIVSRRYLLPAIQRKFTWSCDQICVLFDSIMRGYPINTFMFWEVTDATVKNSFRYYQFLERYCERFEENNPDFDTKGHGDFFAVIDGQQRLTSLYIGLKGTYAYKLPRKWWPKSRDESILPPRKLYLNLLSPLAEEENEQMMNYEFKFLTDSQYKIATNDKSKHWFQVGEILDFDDVETLDKVPLKVVLPYLRQKGLGDNEFALEVLTRLYCAIRKEQLIHYYNEKSQAIDHVLDIFIRTNNGGTPLAYSDLLMSIAIANWKNDARQQIDDLVDQVRFGSDMEFSINRDFVLKASLMLTDADVRFKVKNFTSEQVGKIESEWEGIKTCILETFRLIRSFGLNDSSLRAKNAAIPIAYYLYKKGRQENNIQSSFYNHINNQAKNVDERQVIRKWLHMALLKGMFSGQGDSVLTNLRKLICTNIEANRFPLDAILEDYRGKSKDISFDDDFIDRLLKTQKDDPSCFSILALLLPDLDYTRTLHKDHLHPAASFTKDRLDTCSFVNETPSVRADYEDPEKWNSVLNLHLLDSAKNQSKLDTPLSEWFDKQKSLTKEDLLIPSEVDLEFDKFPQFIKKRAEHLKDILKNLVGSNEQN